MATQITFADGKTYNVAHTFSNTRCIINYQGLYVFADQGSDGTWDLSGEPSRDDEKAVLAALIAPMMDVTVVTITPPEE